jgi:uncharacterized membrane protein
MVNINFASQTGDANEQQQRCVQFSTFWGMNTQSQESSYVQRVREGRRENNLPATFCLPLSIVSFFFSFLLIPQLNQKVDNNVHLTHASLPL